MHKGYTNKNNNHQPISPKNAFEFFPPIKYGCQLVEFSTRNIDQNGNSK